MSPNIHICDRDVCPMKNVSGPKLLCSKCQSTCYLLCLGFEICGNGVKINSNTGCNFAMDPNSICITCPKCDASFLTEAINEKMEQTENGTNNIKPNVNSVLMSQTPNKQKVLPNQTNTSAVTPMSFSQLKQEITKMTRILNTVKAVVDTSSADICELKTVTTDTNNIVKTYNTKSSEFNNVFSTKLNALTNETQSFSNMVKQQHDQRQTFPLKRKMATNNDAAGQTTSIQLPNSSKQMYSKPKNLPQPKTGKRLGAVGLMAAPKVKPKPKFDKALHVSRIEPSVTVEQMNDYIKSNTKLIENEDFKCTLLVKKDKDISTLSFVSFKIDICVDKCEQLTDEDFWPEGVQIRSFVPPTPTFADFLTTSPGNMNTQPNKISKQNEQKNEIEQMQVGQTDTDQPTD